MKRAKSVQARCRQQSLYRVGVLMIYFICAQWISVDSVFVAVEDKVTLPSRNEATNPLKEPTPSTLQGAFLGGNLTDDANKGSTSTPPSADASVASTTAAAAIAETVWNVRTAAAATLPADRRNDSAAAAGGRKPEQPAATTNRPLESWENVVHTSTGRPSSSSSSSSSSAVRGPTTAEETAGGDYGTDLSDNLMANMLKSWFDHKDDSATAAADKGYYDKMAAEYLRNNNGGGGEPSEAQSKTAAAAAAVNKSPFERWDEASEEQERVLEDAMRSERPTDRGGGGGGGGSSSSSVLAADQNTPSRWFVLLLSGNSTVAQMRRTDFAKYLKLNLAARLSLEYDEVKINRVLVVPPRLMVNVSVVPVSERASVAAHDVAVAAAAAAAASSSSSSSSSSSWPSSASEAAVSDRVVENDDPLLHNLVETNATLMELSGEEYRVERFMSLKSQKPQSTDEAGATVSDRHADIDFFIYATVGPLCFVVVLGFLLFTLYKYVRRHPVQWPWNRKFGQPLQFWPGGGDHRTHRHRRMTDDCCATASVDETGCGGSVNVIYSGEFEQSQQQQLSGSWLDDANFVPDDSLDRIRTPTLLRTAQQPPPAVKNKTFTDMLQQCSGGGVDDGDMHRRPLQHHHHHSSRNGQCAASAAAETAVHAQSPRLSRDNKLRILGCKQSCLLLPAVQPAATAAAEETTTAAAAVCENDFGQP